MTEEREPLGALELRIRLVPETGGEAVDTVTTPSMWAIADEWLDEVACEKPHSRAWLQQKLTQAIYLQAAQAAGAMRPGALSLARVAEFMNLYRAVPLDADGNEVAEDGGDGGVEPPPNAGAPAGGA